MRGVRMPPDVRDLAEDYGRRPIAGLVLASDADSVTVSRSFFAFLSWHLSAWEVQKQILQAPEVAACLTDAQRAKVAECETYPEAIDAQFRDVGKSLTEEILAPESEQ